MTTSTTSNGSLKTPPIRPSRFLTREVVREEAIQQSIQTMPIEDQQFMYERIKENQHQERVFTAFLKLIRKYDFLPKNLLIEGFQEAVKHIYAANRKAVRDEKKEQEFVESTSKVCEILQEEEN